MLIVEKNKLYTDSIILIGPSGAGKSTVAEELRKITYMKLNIFVIMLQQHNFMLLIKKMLKEILLIILNGLMKKKKTKIMT